MSLSVDFLFYCCDCFSCDHYSIAVTTTKSPAGSEQGESIIHSSHLNLAVPTLLLPGRPPPKWGWKAGALPGCPSPSSSTVALDGGPSHRLLWLMLQIRLIITRQSVLAARSSEGCFCGSLSRFIVAFCARGQKDTNRPGGI